MEEENKRLKARGKSALVLEIVQANPLVAAVKEPVCQQTRSYSIDASFFARKTTA
ncbi:MAG: hypothetical protein JWN23_344 [Rhodocyclales bacterium]|nr:hypothetical protein [Rhodocyclales bacterium]